MFFIARSNNSAIKSNDKKWRRLNTSIHTSAKFAVHELIINGIKLSETDPVNDFHERFICAANSANQVSMSTTACGTKLFNVAHSRFPDPITDDKVIRTFININNKMSVDKNHL